MRPPTPPYAQPPISRFEPTEDNTTKMIGIYKTRLSNSEKIIENLEKVVQLKQIKIEELEAELDLLRVTDKVYI